MQPNIAYSSNDFLKLCHFNRTYKIGIFLISLIYSFVLVYLIPMDGLIKDRLNYLNYASSSDIIALSYLSKGLLSFLFNEPVWLVINIVLNQFFSTKHVVSIIVFFSAFISAYLILKTNPKYFIFLLFILMFPQVIIKYIIHLRQGLAISIFLLGWFTHSKPFRLILLGLTPFIHSSFFFVLLLLAYVFVLKRMKFAYDLRNIAILILGLAIGLSLGLLANLLGARQANEYQFSTTDVSGLGFIFWLCVFILYSLQGRNFVNKHTFAISNIVFYLTTYFFIEITGRIFESSIIIVLLASLDLTAWRRKCFFATITLFVLLSWLLRLNQPWFGWGTGL